jgi:hypothetical protein
MNKFIKIAAVVTVCFCNWYSAVTASGDGNLHPGEGREREFNKISELIPNREKRDAFFMLSKRADACNKNYFRTAVHPDACLEIHEKLLELGDLAEKKGNKKSGETLRIIAVEYLAKAAEAGEKTAKKKLEEAASKENASKGFQKEAKYLLDLVNNREKQIAS